MAQMPFISLNQFKRLRSCSGKKVVKNGSKPTINTYNNNTTIAAGATLSDLKKKLTTFCLCRSLINSFLLLYEVWTPETGVYGFQDSFFFSSAYYATIDG